MSFQFKLGVCCLVLAAFIAGIFLGIVSSPRGEHLAYVTQDKRGKVIHHGGVEYRVPF